MVCCAKYYSNNGNPRKSIEFCEKALELEEEESFLHNFIADEYYNLQDPFNALKNYKLALKHDPQDEYALESAMMCYGEMTRHAEAEEFFKIISISFLFQKPLGLKWDNSISTEKLRKSNSVFRLFTRD